MFSNRRGLVMWTPIIALSLVGLVPLFRPIVSSLFRR